MPSDDREPSLGSLEGLPHRLDQTAWGQGGTEDLEPDGDELDEDSRDLPRSDEEGELWFGEEAALV